MALPKKILYDGSAEPLPERVPLRAGPLVLIYEQGDLRSVRLGEEEILRRVYVAVRDRNWTTIPGQLNLLRLESGDDSFYVEYEVIHRQGEIDFAWTGRITGDPDGTITFQMSGEARFTFMKNRIGFCVLYPAGLSGHPAQVEHMDGSQEETVFPEDITADQPVLPFAGLRGIRYPAGGAEVATRFAGDVFEMEDQRLWTDASYKVFCTPLSQPYPVEIRQGTRVEQSVTIAVEGTPLGSAGETAAGTPVDDGSAAAATTPAAASAAVIRAQEPVRARIGDDLTWSALPMIGLSTASHRQPISQREALRLRALRLHHLRVELRPADPDCLAQFAQAVDEARLLSARLEVGLFISSQIEKDLTGLEEILRTSAPLPVARWLIYPSQEIYAGGTPVEAVVRAARRHLEKLDHTIPFAAGTNTDYIFLKRNPPPVELIDQVCITLNPQVHAFDNTSLVETLETQPVVVASARRLARGLPVVVSPLTLKPRFNAYLSGPAPETPFGTLPPEVDPRQMSLFGAGWTLGSLRAMVAGGAHSVTYYETTGWRGVMEREDGSPLPERFPSISGAVFPLYYVFAELGVFANGEGAALPTSDPQRVSALALRSGSLQRILLANHTAELLQVRLEGLPGGMMQRTLDEENVEEAMRSPEAWWSEMGMGLRGGGGTAGGFERADAVVNLLPFGLAFL